MLKQLNNPIWGLYARYQIDQLFMETITKLKQLSLLRIGGADSETYLQGQVTTDVAQLENDTWQIASQCDSKGKAWSNFYLFRNGDSYFMLGEASALAITLKELKKYGVFSKVDIEEVTNSYDIVGLIEPNQETRESLKLPELLAKQKASSGKQTVLGIGNNRFIAIAAPGAFEQTDDGGVSEWQAADIKAGLPWLSEATSGQLVPQMFNLQALEGICFTKGCYMGQETIARTKYLGKNKRSGYVLHSDKTSQAAPGDNLEQKLGDNWRRAGIVVNHANLDGSSWVFAVLPHDIDAGTPLRLKDKPEVEFAIQPLPYSLED